MTAPQPFEVHSHRLLGVGIVMLALAAGACSSAASPSAGGPDGSEPAASEAGTARCEVAADAASAADIELVGFEFSGEASIAVGEAVTFTNGDSAGHTVTEGTGGTAADGACVDESIGAGATVVVTFSEPGEYQITCKLHPAMQTVVHVE
jgi:plastocyanin